MRSGPAKARLLPRRSAFRARLSVRKGTPPFGARPATDTPSAVLGHVAEGIGARKTGVHPDTATPDIRRAGDHAGHLHDGLGAFSPGDAGSPVR